MSPRIALVFAACLGLGGTAMAQDGGFTSELERVANASPQEKVGYVQNAVVEIQASFGAIDAMLAQAQDGGGARAVQCVSSRHAAVKAMAGVSEEAERDMLAAIADNAFERADHEFRKIAVALQRTRMLHAEAERCVGGQELADGETTVQIVGDVQEEGAFEDEEWLAVDETDIGFDPPDVSPFR